MSDVTQAFAPTRAKLYRAPLGTNISGITGTSSLPVDFVDCGAIDLSAGYSFTPAGQPSREVIREFWDDAVFYVTKSPSDDLPTWNITFLESNIEVIELAFGVTVDENGVLTYAGGIPGNECIVLDLVEPTASPKTERHLIPNAGVAINGSINPSGQSKLTRYPLTFTGEPSEDLGGGLFRQFRNWLADAS